MLLALLLGAAPGWAQPRAVARVDALVETGNACEAVLDGRRSWDPTGRPLTYGWRVTGPSGPMELEEPSSPRLRARLGGCGLYQAELTVKAGCEEAASRLAFDLQAKGPVAAGGGPEGAAVLPGKTAFLQVLPSVPPSAVETVFVQLYIGQQPLGTTPAALSSDGTARLESVTITAGTTNGAVLTLEQVLENGQFFFPHKVLRTYNVRISATAALQIILGDPGTLFLNPASVGSPQNVLVALGNQVPAIDERPNGGGCAMGGEKGAVGWEWALLLAGGALAIRRGSKIGSAI
ncbi:MAG: hypothetical protein HY303_16145 [Candidatus Wallbacteria bacterium]|nr:hypothetical protein [Candidatus Wallbacteria bacterium]